MKTTEQNRQDNTPLDQLLLARLLQTTENLTTSFTELLGSFGLTFTQYNALRILGDAQRSGLSCSEIGDNMLSRFSDITRLMDRLQKKGYVVRTRDRRDRRTVRTKISAEGTSLLRKLEKPVQQWELKTLEGLSDGQKKTLLDLVEHVRLECTQQI